LDKTYKSDRELPASLQKYLVGTRKWKFRDSNYSPDYPTNVTNALHFYELSGNNANFDGVIAVNASLLGKILDITGPITLKQKDWEKYGQFSSDGILMKLERIVEDPVYRSEERKACEKVLKKAGIVDDGDSSSIAHKKWKACKFDENGKKKKYMSHGEKNARKEILKGMMKEIISKLVKIKNIEPIIQMTTKSLDEKDIQLWFKDTNLQQMARSANWTGEVDKDWDGDYVMISDANVGARKSDYYMKRAMEYTVDFTGKSAEKNDASAGRMVRYIGDNVKEQVMNGTFVTKKPLATVKMTYENTATQASNYNMDYHSFTRLYVPNGSKWYVREWFEPPGVEQNVFGNKQVYSYVFHVLLGDTIPTMLQYTLPDNITQDGYKLKIQKQSGIGNIPLKVTVITSDGKKYTKQIDFVSDTVFALKNADSGKELVVVK